MPLAMHNDANLRAELKAWERDFEAQNACKPTIDDIRRHPDIAAKYRRHKMLSRSARSPSPPPPVSYNPFASPSRPSASDTQKRVRDEADRPPIQNGKRPRLFEHSGNLVMNEIHDEEIHSVSSSPVKSNKLGFNALFPRHNGSLKPPPPSAAQSIAAEATGSHSKPRWPTEAQKDPPVTLNTASKAAGRKPPPNLPPPLSPKSRKEAEDGFSDLLIMEWHSPKKHGAVGSTPSSQDDWLRRPKWADGMQPLSGEDPPIANPTQSSSDLDILKRERDKRKLARDVINGRGSLAETRGAKIWSAGEHELGEETVEDEWDEPEATWADAEL